MIDHEDLTNRFTYHPPTGDQPATYERIRAWGHDFANFINLHAPDGREKSLAVTHIEEAVMWANAAIARQPEYVSDSVVERINQP